MQSGMCQVRNEGWEQPWSESPIPEIFYSCIIRVSFSALRQQGGSSSGDITMMGEAVLISITNPVVRCWIQRTRPLTSGGFSFQQN